MLFGFPVAAPAAHCPCLDRACAAGAAPALLHLLDPFLGTHLLQLFRLDNWDIVIELGKIPELLAGEQHALVAVCYSFADSAGTNGAVPAPAVLSVLSAALALHFLCVHRPPHLF